MKQYNTLELTECGAVSGVVEVSGANREGSGDKDSNGTGMAGTLF